MYGSEIHSADLLADFKYIELVVIIVRLVIGIQTTRSGGEGTTVQFREKRKACNDYCCKEYEAE